MIDRSHVLTPFAPGETMSTKKAAELANLSERQMREWCSHHGIGKLIGGRWRVSEPALNMLLNADGRALEAYKNGDRTSSLVSGYFEALGVHLP